MPSEYVDGPGGYPYPAGGASDIAQRAYNVPEEIVLSNPERIEAFPVGGRSSLNDGSRRA